MMHEVSATLNPCMATRLSEHADKGKACALHNWQVRPKWDNTDGLKQRCDTCKKHCQLDQIDLLWTAKTKPRGTGNNNRWGDI